MMQNIRKILFLKWPRVIIEKPVDAHHLMIESKKFFRKMGSDKTGDSSD